MKPEVRMRAIALYLPQFHPIPENDQWWGKGFTEWTNVTKAKPLYKGHYQPHLPADMGFYDLRLSETREAQAELARQYGVHGFCYYHYWFNGRRILERPFEEVLASGRPDFPFCLCWANENWTRRWDGMDREILLKQDYSLADDLAHIRALMPAFTDQRYIRIDGKPLFLVYRSSLLPECRRTTDIWRREAQAYGLRGLYLVCVESMSDEGVDPEAGGFDASLEFQPRWGLLEGKRLFPHRWWHRLKLGTPDPGLWDNFVFRYSDLVQAALAQKERSMPRIRCVCPSWDNSARRRQYACIVEGSSPELYREWLEKVCSSLPGNPKSPRIEGDPVVFINAWNEWAEGNHLEPCQKWGRAYLEATRDALETKEVGCLQLA